MAVAHPPAPGVPVSSAHLSGAQARPDLLARWPLHAVVWAAAGIVVGLIWDISWHRSVGRDTLFSPPHVLEYISALVAGLSCGYVVLRTTFGGSAQVREATVRFWGFRGPLGAWVTIWGTFTMLVSAPFDDWWHNAYGLDVEILSPPHVLLLFGMLAIILGALLMSLAAQNRAAGGTRGMAATLSGPGAGDGATAGGVRAGGASGGQTDARLYAVSGGITVLMVATSTMQYTGFPNLWHGAFFYQISAATLPLLLVAVARAGRLRWPATSAALFYVAVTLVAAWILQMVPATPKLPPILNPIDRMVPPPFPFLLFVPALAIDLLVRRWDGTRATGAGGVAAGGGAGAQPRQGATGAAFPWGRDLLLAALVGVSFVPLLLLVQWPLADFLLSPAAENPLFFQGKWDYNVALGPGLKAFWNLDTVDGVWSLPLFLRGLGLAVALAVASSLVGLRAGAWMAGVQR